VRRGVPFTAAAESALASLPEPDRRLAHEIAAGVLRHRDTLDARLAPLLARRWPRLPPDLRDVLRIGSYQLKMLTRIPAYAAVQATVEAARGTMGRKAAGLVNAVLRRLAAEGERPEGGAEPSLARKYSHPQWLVDRWLARFGAERTEALLAHHNRRPPVVLQPAGWSAERLRETFIGAGVPVADAPFGEGLAVSRVRIPELPGYADGAFMVQDAAQARLLRLAEIPDGATVWDACAAPGGKAAVLAQRCRVIASDARRDRLPRLRDTLRHTVPGVPVLAADARRPPLRPGSMEVVLLDAPCSATGTIARHPDARWRLSPAGIARAARRQAELLDAVAAVVRPGGLLIYLTCSLEPEENEEQIERFLRRHPAFARTGADLCIFPADAGTDGGYGARLRRTA
jgi:16S rRNA (cytosine967-C5)-methyltransferase